MNERGAADLFGKQPEPKENIFTETDQSRRNYNLSQALSQGG